jgi:hypothetical protein
MKNITLLMIFVFLASCHPTKDFPAYRDNITNIEMGCPTDGICEIEVKENKAMDIMTDASGSFFYKLHDDNSKAVIVFSYTKSTPKEIQDGTYKEEVVMEIDKSQKATEIVDFSSGIPKILFGRFCYCKGYTGYYKIDSGKLKIALNGNKKDFYFNFKINEVPQVLENIHFTLK